MTHWLIEIWLGLLAATVLTLLSYAARYPAWLWDQIGWAYYDWLWDGYTVVWELPGNTATWYSELLQDMEGTTS